jgi:methylmalonyl-CoA mutase C-terminal domain/subunit
MVWRRKLVPQYAAATRFEGTFSTRVVARLECSPLAHALLSMLMPGALNGFSRAPWQIPREVKSMRSARKQRLLIGKPGLDGHDRGAKYVAHVLRDAGFEVIYTGIRRSPEQIVEAAIQEDVAGIGLSLLSGAHNVLFRRVLELLRARHAEDIVVFGGGTIPERDITPLKEMGIAAVFTPGTPANRIIETIDQLLAERAAS